MGTEEQAVTQANSTPVLWFQVWSLAAMQGAVALMWIIYNLYLAKLLISLGFPATWATTLLVVENALAIVLEPVLGNFSDRLQQQLGTRLPLVSLGVILAAGLFLAIPAVALGGVTFAQRWLLPTVLIAWALAMTTFRSPVLSLLGRCAFQTRLPEAASILTLVGGVTGAMAPLAGDLILGWGAGVAFALGSGVLVGATLLLRWVVAQAPALKLATATGETLPRAVEVPIAILPPMPLSWPNLGRVFGTGVGVTLGFRALLTLFPQVLAKQAPLVPVPWVMGSIFLALAIAALPAGKVALHLGNQRAMVLGLGLLSFVSITISTLGNTLAALILAILLGAAFSLVSNGTIPFALSLVPEFKAGLGTGMFFGGGAAANALLGGLTPHLQRLDLAGMTAIALLSFLMAAVCILTARLPVPKVFSGNASGP